MFTDLQQSNVIVFKYSQDDDFLKELFVVWLLIDYFQSDLLVWCTYEGSQRFPIFSQAGPSSKHH